MTAPLATTRRRVAALLAAAIALLLGRVLIRHFEVGSEFERGLYLLALGCLLGCILLIAADAR